jgi:hypothetical protein
MVKSVPGLVLCVVLGARPVIAQTEAAPGRTGTTTGVAVSSGADLNEAKRAFEEGLQFLHEGQWSGAEEAFRRSLAIVPRESARYDLAYVLFKRERIKQSLGILKELVERSDGADPRYRDYATTLLPHVLSHLARLHVRTDPTAALVVDGEPTGGLGPDRDVTVDPGSHVAELSVAGSPVERFEFSAAPGAVVERTVLVPIATVPEPTLPAQHAGSMKTPDRPTRAGSSPIHSVGPWVTMGIGGALLVGSAVSGLLARNADNEFVGACPTLRGCDPSLQDTRDRVVRLGHISDALLVSGIAVASGGIVWKVLAASPAVHSTSQRGFLVGVAGVF